MLSARRRAPLATGIEYYDLRGWAREDGESIRLFSMNLFAIERITASRLVKKSLDPEHVD
jgi:hypothetical protein